LLRKNVLGFVNEGRSLFVNLGINVLLDLGVRVGHLCDNEVKENEG